MTSPHPTPPSSTTPLAACFRQAARFWEPRRLLYNLVLTLVVAAWILVSWPHFRPAMTLGSLLLLAVLAALANLCYCAAYPLDLLAQLHDPLFCSPRRRWTLWLLGTLFAVLLANYWIADEIYPFVR
jgi:hypothetical protein